MKCILLDVKVQGSKDEILLTWISANVFVSASSTFTIVVAFQKPLVNMTGVVFVESFDGYAKSYIFLFPIFGVIQFSDNE